MAYGMDIMQNKDHIIQGIDFYLIRDNGYTDSRYTDKINTHNMTSSCYVK